MTKFLSLLGLTFKQQLRSKPDTNKKQSKVGTIVVMVVLAIVFLPILASVFVGCMALGQMIVASGEMSITQQQLNSVVGGLVMVSQGVTLVFGFSAVLSNVFNSKDGDKLLYLPVSANTVFLAKFVATYLTEMALSTLMLLVTVLPFGIGAGVGFCYYAMFVPLVFLAPLLPMLIATLVAMPLSLLFAKLGKGGVAKTVFNIVLYCVLLVAYILLVRATSNMEGGESDGTQELLTVLWAFVQSVSAVVPFVHPNYLLGGALAANSIGTWAVNFVLALAEYAILAALVWLCARKFYNYLLSVGNEGANVKTVNKKAVKANGRTSSVVGKLMATDLKRVVRDSQMGFQCFAGLVILPIFVVIVAISVSGELGEEGTIAQLVQQYQLIVCWVAAMLLTMMSATTNVLGLFPVSRENKSLYLLKTLPVPFEKIILSKVLLATIVMSVVYFIALTVMVLMLGVNVFAALLMFVALVGFGFGNMCWTIKSDLKNPVLGWTNFQTSLKNGKTSLVAMLVGFVALIVIAFVGIPFLVWFVESEHWFATFAMLLALDVVAALYAFVGYKVLCSGAKQLFDSIEP